MKTPRNVALNENEQRLFRNILEGAAADLGNRTDTVAKHTELVKLLRASPIMTPIAIGIRNASGMAASCSFFRRAILACTIRSPTGCLIAEVGLGIGKPPAGRENTPGPRANRAIRRAYRAITGRNLKGDPLEFLNS